MRAFPLTRSTGRRAGTAWTVGGLRVEMGRGQEAFDLAARCGLLAQVKRSSGGTVVIGVGASQEATRAATAAGRPYILVAVDADVAPDSLPAGGGDCTPPNIKGVKVYDLGAALRGTPEPRTVAGRGHGEVVYYTIQRQAGHEYKRLNVNLRALTPIATFADLDGLAGWVNGDEAKALVTWTKRANYLASAGVDGHKVTLKDDQTIQVDGRPDQWVCIDRESTDFMAKVMATSAPVPWCAERAKWLRRELATVGLDLKNHRKEGYTLTRA